MTYLALGVAALALYLWVTSGRFAFKRREWRLASAAAALAAFTGAAFAGVRGGWGPAIVLVVVGLWFAATARVKPGASSSQRSGQGVASRDSMSLDEARRILGVGPEAGRTEIQEAYTRLMRAVHPDKGGTAGLAAQLNAARDRLLARSKG